MRIEIKTKKGFRNPVDYPDAFVDLCENCSYDEKTKHLILWVFKNDQTWKRLHSLENTDFLVEGETPASVEVRQKGN